MSVLDKKKKVFGNIAAAKTLTEGMPKLKKSSSFSSINNGGNVITFLTDLIKSLLGSRGLIKLITEFLTVTINNLEPNIKKALKLELKSTISCGINPSLSDLLKSNNDGLIMPIKKIDFLDILKTSPTSTIGKLIYQDVDNGLNSSDFNTFLYNVIQNEGQTHIWKGILQFTFNSLDPLNVNGNNILTIKTTPDYDNKSLNDLNNNFIDSLTLFYSDNLVNKLIDIIFGSVSLKIGKTRKQLENEGKINAVIDKIVNSDEGETISDTYFTFDNEELSKIQNDADERKKGVIKVKASTTIEATVPDSQLSILSEEMGTAVTTQQKKDVLSKNLESMAESNTANSTNESDNTTIKLNFFQAIIENLTKSIVGVLLTPKVVLVLLLNFKIIYGPTASYDDGVDFIKKNKKIFRAILKTVSNTLITFLLTIAVKELTRLIAESQAKIQTDKLKNKQVQLASLAGVQQEALRIIKGLG
jgi:hypothetical protein